MVGNLYLECKLVFSFREFIFVEFITGMDKRYTEFVKNKKKVDAFSEVYWMFKITLSNSYSVFLGYADFGLSFNWIPLFIRFGWFSGIWFFAGYWISYGFFIYSFQLSLLLLVTTGRPFVTLFVPAF